MNHTLCVPHSVVQEAVSRNVNVAAPPPPPTKKKKKKKKWGGGGGRGKTGSPYWQDKNWQWETEYETVGGTCPTECRLNCTWKVRLWNAVYGEKRTCPGQKLKTDQLGNGPVVRLYYRSHKAIPKDLYSGHIFCGIVPQRNEESERRE